jgi:hypothetical protein
MKEEIPSTEARSSVLSVKEEPQDEVHSASSGDVSTTQNATPGWYMQGSQVLRCIASRFCQAVRKHVFRRAPNIPMCR